jgi:hypothetical protein
MLSLVVPWVPEAERTDDTLWPILDRADDVRWEPGEVRLGSVLAKVSEHRVFQGSKAQILLQPTWQLVGAVECVITDRRFTYRGRRLADPMHAADPDPRSAHTPTFYVGQVRFEWR